MSDLFDKDHMNELVRMDPDLPAIPRWQTVAIFMPSMAEFLIKTYAKNKKERKKLMEMLVNGPNP